MRQRNFCARKRNGEQIGTGYHRTLENKQECEIIVRILQLLHKLAAYFLNSRTIYYELYDVLKNIKSMSNSLQHHGTTNTETSEFRVDIHVVADVLQMCQPHINVVQPYSQILQ